MLVNNLTLIYRFIIRCQAFTIYVTFFLICIEILYKRQKRKGKKKIKREGRERARAEKDRENEKAAKERHIKFGKQKNHELKAKNYFLIHLKYTIQYREPILCTICQWEIDFSFECMNRFESMRIY